MPSLPSSTPSEDSTVPTQERPLYLLMFFTAQHHTWTLSNLARVSGLPIASCHRAIRVLEKYQFLRRDQNQYRLGSQIVRLSANAMSSSPSRRLALPHLEQLHRQTQKPVVWSVLEGHDAHILELVNSLEQPAAALHVGAPLDLSSGAAARVLLAFAPQDIRRTLLDQIWSTQVNTRTRQERLDGLTRKSWLALDVLSQPVPRAEIAAPVFQGDGRLVAALSLERPYAPRPSRAALIEELTLLNHGAQRISRELGYTREWQGDPAFFIQIIEGLNILAVTEDAAVGTDLVNYPT